MAAAAGPSGLGPAGSAWPRRQARAVRCSARGFTLLEILLAVALIGLLSSALVVGSLHLVGDRPVSADQVFWDVSREARKLALKDERDVRLAFDDKEKAFVLGDEASGGAQRFPVPGPRELTVTFLAVTAEKNAVLIGGQLLENRGLPYVTFFADGTCAPFRVQFRASGTARVLSIDPWTCAEVLTPADQAGF